MRKFLFFIAIPFILSACKSQVHIDPEDILEVIEELAVEVKEPEFQIVSIAIIQADLVNTKFQAALRIDNPNDFAVNLSSLTYRLYGNGDLWADGRDNNILHIPAQSSCETKFRFTMNFINMNRKLLDDIIAMRQVRYRFSGNVEVETALPNIPSFQMSFERSGLSDVKQRAD